MNLTESTVEKVVYYTEQDLKKLKRYPRLAKQYEIQLYILGHYMKC